MVAAVDILVAVGDILAAASFAMEDIQVAPSSMAGIQVAPSFAVVGIHTVMVVGTSLAVTLAGHTWAVINRRVVLRFVKVRQLLTT